MNSRERDRAERRRARSLPKIVNYDPLWPSIRQPGRRYGPPPKQTSVGGLQRAEWQHPTKLDNSARELNYRRQNGMRGLTPRQTRRLRQKGATGA